MKKTEICNHCGGDYVPKRRGVQKFCSNSCRSRFWQLKQPVRKDTAVTEAKKSELPEIKSEPKNESMSWAGIGNTAVGIGLYELLKKLLTAENNKLVKKKDLDELKSLIMGKRYFPVNNYLKDNIGRKPYFDIETGNVEYLFL